MPKIKRKIFYQFLEELIGEMLLPEVRKGFLKILPITYMYIPGYTNDGKIVKVAPLENLMYRVKISEEGRDDRYEDHYYSAGISEKLVAQGLESRNHFLDFLSSYMRFCSFTEFKSICEIFRIIGSNDIERLLKDNKNTIKFLTEKDESRDEVESEDETEEDETEEDEVESEDETEVETESETEENVIVPLEDQSFTKMVKLKQDGDKPIYQGLPWERKLKSSEFFVRNENVVSCLAKAFDLDSGSKIADLWRHWRNEGGDEIGTIVAHMKNGEIDSNKVQEFLSIFEDKSRDEFEGET